MTQIDLTGPSRDIIARRRQKRAAARPLTLRPRPKAPAFAPGFEPYMPAGITRRTMTHCEYDGFKPDVQYFKDVAADMADFYPEFSDRRLVQMRVRLKQAQRRALAGLEQRRTTWQPDDNPAGLEPQEIVYSWAVTMEIQSVCRTHGVTWAELSGPDISDKITKPRFFLMRRLCMDLGLSRATVGRIIGRDRTSVTNGIQRAQDIIDRTRKLKG